MNSSNRSSGAKRPGRRRPAVDDRPRRRPRWAGRFLLSTVLALVVAAPVPAALAAPAAQPVAGSAPQNAALSDAAQPSRTGAGEGAGAGRVSPAVGTQAVENPARVFHFNMCGAVRDNDKCTSKGGSGEGTSVPAIVSSAVDYQPDIVTLNEVCENQFDALLDQLEAGGYAMDGRFGTARPDVSTCDGSDYGNAVLSRRTILNDAGEQLSHPLPGPDGAEVRQLLCVDTPLRGRNVKACATHLSSSGGKQATQVSDGILPVVNTWLDAGIPVLIGGDFNVRPTDDALTPLYSRDGGTGRFREMDETDFDFFTVGCRNEYAESCRSGEGTHDEVLVDPKIDYVFFSEDFAKPRGDATTSPVSDHDPLRATAVVAAGPPARVFQFNMKGVIDEGDSDGSTEVGAVPAVVGSVSDFHPDIVTLNELCEQQFDSLATKFAQAGWRMYGMWDGDVRHDNCGPGDTDGWAGKALFSREPVVPEPNVTDHMGCASTELRGRTIQACVLHLPTDADDNVVESRKAAEAVDPYVDQGVPTLLAGDFNAEPGDTGMDHFYRHNGGTGRFHDADERDRFHCVAARTTEESCRSGEVTFPTFLNPRKLDYVFLSDEFTDVRADATTTDISDHLPLRGWASLLPGPGSGDPGPGPGPGDLPPTVDAGPPVTGDEGAAIQLLGSASDDTSTPRVTWSYTPVSGADPGTSCAFADPASPRTTLTCTDNGVFRATITASDGVNAGVSDSTLVTVRNVAPTLSMTGPAPWQVFRAGTPVPLKASFTDPGANDTHTCAVTWDDGTSDTYVPGTGSSCDRTHTFTVPGMYTIKVSVTDDDGGTGTGEVMVIVYDPDAGFGTAGGTMDTTGADGTAGSARFQFNTQYAPGDEGPVPTKGKVSFRHDSGPDFDSDAFEWLVVTPDNKVAVKGSGTLAGHTGRYNFVLYAHDSTPDRLRLVLWPSSAGSVPGDTITYDVHRGASYDLDQAEPQPIRGGSMVVHH